jgi:hypothetical protein
MAAQNVYGGLAEIGKLKATVGLVVAACVALSCCVSGGFTIKSAMSDKHTASANATLSNVNCTSNLCTAVGTYSVSGQTYTLGVNTGNPAPSSVSISYDPAKPSDAEQNKPSTGLGIGLIVGGFIVIIIGYLFYWLTMNYKPIAAIEGAGAVYDIGKAVF